MQSANVIIFICGAYCISFAIFHCLFWKLFNWKDDLAKLNFANRAVMQIANLRLIYFFLLVGVICFAFPSELITTNLGRFFLGGISLFWFGRTVEQFVFLRRKHKAIHILTFIFIAGIILFALPLLLYFII